MKLALILLLTLFGITKAAEYTVAVSYEYEEGFEECPVEQEEKLHEVVTKAVQGSGYNAEDDTNTNDDKKEIALRGSGQRRALCSGFCKFMCNSMGTYCSCCPCCGNERRLLVEFRDLDDAIDAVTTNIKSLMEKENGITCVKQTTVNVIAQEIHP